MSTLILARLLHIVFGAIWVGTAVFLAVFLLPTIRAVGPAGGAVMQHLAQVKRLSLYIMGFALIAVFSGGWLVWYDAGEKGMQWFQAGSGRFFGTGAVLAIIALAIGMSVSSPAARRIGALGASIQGAGRPPLPSELAEMQALGKRLGIGTMLVMVFVLGAVAFMSVARYLG